MAETTYDYSIQNDFPNHAVASDKLADQIRASSIVTALARVDTAGDVCSIVFRDALSTGDKTTLDGVVAAHDGVPVPSPAKPVTIENIAEDADSRLRVTTEPRKNGSGCVIVSHNWADPTTWYTESVRVEDEELSTSDNLTFSSAHENWIDLTHGKVYREDLISDAYVPLIKVDGVVQTEREPWEESGGDYEIHYATGEVTFFASQAGKTVTADYSYENGSLFVIAPSAGKRLWVEYSEVQFSADIDITASTNFQPWAYNPADPPNKVAAAAATVYKNLDNYIEEANGTYPAIPAMGGTRGFSSGRMTFPFKYQTLKELRSSQGVEIRIWLEDDEPFGGSYGTATFYCTSYDDE